MFHLTQHPFLCKKNALPIFFALYLISPLSQSQAATSLFDLSLEELMNVPINSAGKTVKTAGEIPASVIIIEREEIRRYGYSNLEEVLSNIPGLYMTEDWAWFGSVNYGVRGLYAKGNFDNMAITVNGVSQLEDGKRSYPIEKINVPVQAIDRIEVIRGPMSVTYGSSAFMGVINIITNLQDSLSENTLVSYSRGNYESQKKFVRMSGTEGEYQFVFNAQNQSSGGPSNPYRDLISDPSFLPTEWNLQPDDKTVLNNHSQYFDFSAQFRSLKLYLSHIDAVANVIDSQPGVGVGTRGFIKATNIAIKYHRLLNQDWEMNATAAFFYNQYFLDEEYNFRNFYSDNQSKTQAQEYELNFIWTPNPNTNAVFGLMRRSGQYRAADDYPTFALENTEILVDEQDGLNTNAIFFQLSHRIIEDLLIVAGLRAEWQEGYDLSYFENNIDINNQQVTTRHFAYDDVRYTPQLAAIYDIDRYQHLKLMLSEGEKAASPANNLSLLELNRPALDPEKTRALELSYIFANPELFLQFGVFFNEASDLIVSNAFLENDVFISIIDNIGKIETNGIELTTSYQATPNLKLNMDMSYHYTQDKTPGYENIDPAYAPDLLANLRLSYRLNANTHLSLLAHYTDSVFAEWVIGNTGNTLQQRIDNGSRSGEDIDAQHSFDLNMTMDNVFTQNLNLGVKIGNLTDEKLRYPTINNRAFDKGTLARGRHWLATLSYNF